MFLPGAAYALDYQVRTVTGEIVGRIFRWNVQANRWIDSLSQGPQILAWIGIALAAYLVVALACVLTDTPFLGVGAGSAICLVRGELSCVVRHEIEHLRVVRQSLHGLHEIGVERRTTQLTSPRTRH